MARPIQLSGDEVQARLEAIPHWKLQDGKLRCELKFDSFERAFGYLTALALVASRLDHHPEIFNVYNRVDLTLWTHDADGLTKLDFELAEAAERLLASAL